MPKLVQQLQLQFLIVPVKFIQFVVQPIVLQLKLFVLQLEFIVFKPVQFQQLKLFIQQLPELIVFE